MKAKTAPAAAPHCPWCHIGFLFISEGSTVDEVWTAPHGYIESRERPCMIAACNACEFAVEVTDAGARIPANGFDQPLFDTLEEARGN